ncbi:acyltransferase family protein [Methylobacterium brachythecii]|uniref:Peptidoglycan/LPS O-acetylase OafA/YrhL n=1 Tax=Methylobacterium brachythecii TaxID=1176177 RepID=A0A7W6AKL0_9HYPH|nr:acyltransferase [Methylobacterium brachythecii]MBB3902536.1 peptidoglycan/LPS O-acetylase OafA/YrhL [Methylobacterium brachythecii]
MSTSVVAPPAGSDAKVLVQIQWLRAVAAITVVFHHANFHWNGLREALDLPSADFLGLHCWWFGIYIFFVISGFLMVRASPDFGVPGAPRRFLARRMIRIVPLYWLLTTLSVIAVILIPSSEVIETGTLAYVVKSYLFIPTLRAAGDVRPILGQGWTLNYEMFFYLCFALAMLLPRRLGLPALTAAFLALAWIGRDATVATPIFYSVTDGLLVVFLFGCGLGLAHEKGLRLSWPIALATIVAGIAWLLANLQGSAPWVAGVPALLVVAGVTLRPPPRETVAGRWFAAVGDASYSLYLTHTFVLRGVFLVWKRLWLSAATVPFFMLASSLAAVLASLLIYRYVERPMTRALLARYRAMETSGRLPALAPAAEPRIA